MACFIGVINEYILSDIVDCKIDGLGMIHLSKARWPIL